MATDNYSSVSPGLTAPAERSFIITPHDTDELSTIPRAVHVGTSGDIVGRLKGDAADRTFKVVAGMVYSYRFQYIRATGTTAGALVGLE